MSNDHQRITVIIDTPDMPSNDAAAARALAVVIRQLNSDGIYPSFIRLELAPRPSIS